MELDHLRGELRQAHRRAAARDRAAVGLRQEQHVVDHRREALQLLEVADQRLLQLFGRALPRQREFGVADQAREGRAQLVRDVGVEAFELRVRLLEPTHQRVELLDPRQQLLGRVSERETLVEPAGRDRTRLRRQVRERPQLPAHAQVGAGRDHAARDERQHDEHDGPVAAHARIAREVLV